MIRSICLILNIAIVQAEVQVINSIGQGNKLTESFLMSRALPIAFCTLIVECLSKVELLKLAEYGNFITLSHYIC